MEFLDGIFLETLTRDENLAQSAFPALLKKTRGDELAAFMAENPRWTDLFKIIGALPKKPFMRGMGRYFQKRIQRDLHPEVLSIQGFK